MLWKKVRLAEMKEQKKKNNKYIKNTLARQEAPNSVGEWAFKISKASSNSYGTSIRCASGAAAFSCRDTVAAKKTLAAIIASHSLPNWSRTIAALDQAVASSRQRAVQQPRRGIQRGWRKIIKEGHRQGVKENGSRSRTSQEHARRTSTQAARMQSSFKILMQGHLRKNLLDSARYTKTRRDRRNTPVKEGNPCLGCLECPGCLCTTSHAAAETPQEALRARGWSAGHCLAVILSTIWRHD